MAKGVKIEGLNEVQQVLGELPKATERTLLRRLAKKALEPMQARAKQLVPVDEGKLRDSIVIGSRLTRSAKRHDRKEPRHGVRLFLGTANRNAVPREFGSVRSAAQPYMRPAFDAEAEPAIKFVLDNLDREIQQTAARAAKRKAKR